MKKYSWMSSAAVVIGALRIKFYYLNNQPTNIFTVANLSKHQIIINEFLTILIPLANCKPSTSISRNMDVI